MSNIFWKNFHLCFTKFMCLPTAAATTIHQSPLSDQNHDHTSPSTTTTSLILKNFNTLYDPSVSTSKSLTTTTFSTELCSSYSSSSASVSDTEESDPPPPDFATVFASQRFFFSSPGRSNSIIESPETRTTTEDSETTPLNGGVAVKKYSPDPYMDFRRSMQEMIEARELTDVRTDGEFLHELLFCYLSLNPKHTHKFIISAFADIMITLLSPPESDSYRKPEFHRQ